jgi:hypothetical protein
MNVPQYFPKQKNSNFPVAQPPEPQVKPSITCEKFRPFSRNTLQGFCTLLLPSGLRLHDCTLHEKEGKRWVGLPSRPYKDESGRQKWSAVVDIPDYATRERFCVAALAAIDAFILAHPEIGQLDSSQEVEGEGSF